MRLFIPYKVHTVAYCSTQLYSVLYDLCYVDDLFNEIFLMIHLFMNMMFIY